MDFSNFDLDIFETAVRRPRLVTTVASSYKAITVYDGWFTQKGLEFEEQFQTKLGPNELLSAAERLYLLKDFEGALSISVRWLEANRKRKKPIQHLDIYDLAARCASRLGRPEDARRYLENLPPINDPGVFYLKGQIMGQCGDFNLAFHCFRQYLEARPTDYTAWREIAYLFWKQRSACQSEEGVARKVNWEYSCASWAHKCMKKALARVDKSSRERDATPLSSLHRRTELKDMEDFIETTNALLRSLTPTETASLLYLELDTEVAEWIDSLLDVKREDLADDGDLQEEKAAKAL
ncbi:hypothetical protein HDU67_005822 [Dinochytrium kinnereticum]|nr:hypothetical protein HDU67_005822 [Dinochytrium kinnereticum]